MTKKSAIPDTVTITIPFRVAKRGGRKEVQLPPGTNNRSPDYTLIKAVARAFRWRQISESKTATWERSQSWQSTKRYRHHT